MRYLCKKEGKRPWAHTIMKARSYFATGISEPLCEIFGIDEQAFDLYFRNWVISNRSEIAKKAMDYVIDNMYGLDRSTQVKKGGKYHKDFIHSASYFLNIRTFEISKNEKDLKMLRIFWMFSLQRISVPVLNIKTSLPDSISKSSSSIPTHRKTAICRFWRYRDMPAAMILQAMPAIPSMS